MDASQREFILHVLETAKDLTLATVRPDGYPQATTVSYAHDDLLIYVGIGKESQKAHNLRLNNKVSLTINLAYQEWNEIKGLSMAAEAEFLKRPEDIERAGTCMVKRFPQIEQWIKSGDMHDVLLLRITPQIISLLDYEKGFGHTELVRT